MILDQLPVVHGVPAQPVLQLLDWLNVADPALRVHLTVDQGTGLVVQVEHLHGREFHSPRAERDVLECTHLNHDTLRSRLIDHILQPVPRDLNSVRDGDDLLHDAVSLHVPELGRDQMVAELGVHHAGLGTLHVRAQAVPEHVVAVHNPPALVDHLVCMALVLILALVPILKLCPGVH